MTTTLMPLPKQQFLSNLGTPLVGGKVYTYAAGTSNLKATYTDAAGTTPQPNPIPLNLRGEPAAPIFWSGNYKVEVRDLLDNVIYTVDNFNTDPANLWGLVNQLATTNAAALIGFLFPGTGAVLRTVSDELNEVLVNVKRFGAKGDGVTNDNPALLKAVQWAIDNLPAKLYFPKGTYLYTNLGNLAKTGLTLEGESDRGVVLKCTSTTAAHSALLLDAFASGSGTDPFIQRCNLRNITLEGNALTAKIIDAQGLARCNWQNVVVRTAEPTTGIGVHLRGVQLSTFTNLICSTDLDAMATKPREGLRLEEGRRAGVSVGNSSNNLFLSTYQEGMPIGIRILGGDQNTFVGGSPESNTVYGLLVGVGCRYNTFIGTSFESSASTADIGDGGISTQFINIYSSKAILLQGRGAKVSGGFFERIEIQAGATKNCIENVTFNHWASGAGGFYDSGTATEWKNLYDEDAAKFVYPLKDRTGIAVGATPFQWTNTTGQYVEVILQTGVVTQIRILRGTDSWLNPTAIPGKHLLAPTDIIEVSYSAAPGMSYVPHNGFQG